MIEVNIKGLDKKYPIFFEKEEISELKNKILEFIGNKKYVVVISQKVEKIYGKELSFENKYILKDGEKQKNIKNYKKILDFCLKKKLSREDVIIAVGGGVVGDIAGFAASTYMRGIDYIQVPTTLLACVDSSVGGKVAVNTPFGKNLIGAFYQPKAVFIYPNFLKTLSLKEFKTGLGEVVKYAFIEKSCKHPEEFNLVHFLDINHKKIFDYNLKVLEELIKICIWLKVSVVEQDEREGGLRRILNFGHTYGHAIEKLTNYRKYTHGECVVAGIYFAFDLALKNNLIEKNYMYLMQDVMKKFEFKQIPSFDIKKVIPIMKTDKKSANDLIHFILPVDYSTVKEFEFNDLLTIS
ncbi:3-dehydroquinate synthase [bacterium]|nr:3-dehydroquinate synthase [bacterium]